MDPEEPKNPIEKSTTVIAEVESPDLVSVAEESGQINDAIAETLVDRATMFASHYSKGENKKELTDFMEGNLYSSLEYDFNELMKDTEIAPAMRIFLEQEFQKIPSLETRDKQYDKIEAIKIFLQYTTKNIELLKSLLERIPTIRLGQREDYEKEHIIELFKGQSSEAKRNIRSDVFDMYQRYMIATSTNPSWQGTGLPSYALWKMWRNDELTEQISDKEFANALVCHEDNYLNICGTKDGEIIKDLYHLTPETNTRMLDLMLEIKQDLIPTVSAEQAGIDASDTGKRLPVLDKLPEIEEKTGKVILEEDPLPVSLYTDENDGHVKSDMDTKGPMNVIGKEVYQETLKTAQVAKSEQEGKESEIAEGHAKIVMQISKGSETTKGLKDVVLQIKEDYEKHKKSTKRIEDLKDIEEGEGYQAALGKIQEIKDVAAQEFGFWQGGKKRAQQADLAKLKKEYENNHMSNMISGYSLEELPDYLKKDIDPSSLESFDEKQFKIKIDTFKMDLNNNLLNSKAETEKMIYAHNERLKELAQLRHSLPEDYLQEHDVILPKNADIRIPKEIIDYFSQK